jgi:hypothetical protein
MECRRDAAPVQEKDRLPAPVCKLAELGEKRGGQGVSRLSSQVDDPHRRQRVRQAAAELESFEACPALRPRRRAAEDGDGALEGGSLGGYRAGVITRVGLVLVRRILLLVDADETEVGDRREDGRAGADHHARVAGGDAFAFISTLGVRQARMEHCHAVAETGAETPRRLRGKRDLRNEHDRSAPAGKSFGTCLEVDLGLTAAGCSEQEERGADAFLHSRPDPCQRILLFGGERRRSGFAGKVVLDAPPWSALSARTRRRRDQSERTSRRGAVVVGEPEGQVDERRRNRADDPLDGNRLDVLRSLLLEADDDAAAARAAERDRDDRALLEPVREVRKRPRERACGDQRVDGGKASQK